SHRKQLSATPEAAGPHGGTFRQRSQVRSAAQRIAWVGPLRNGDDRQPVRQLSWNVLRGVHGEIDLAGEECLLDLLDEARFVGQLLLAAPSLVTRRSDPNDLGVGSELLERSRNDVRLGEGKSAAARADAYGGHAGSLAGLAPDVTGDPLRSVMSGGGIRETQHAPGGSPKGTVESKAQSKSAVAYAGRSSNRVAAGGIAQTYGAGRAGSESARGDESGAADLCARDPQPRRDGQRLANRRRRWQRGLSVRRLYERRVARHLRGGVAEPVGRPHGEPIAVSGLTDEGLHAARGVGQPGKEGPAIGRRQDIQGGNTGEVGPSPGHGQAGARG